MSRSHVLEAGEAEFAELLFEVLSPSRPLQSEELLRGRSEQLRGIETALYAPGRHVLIHGLRGVGKSSLAHTAAYKLSRGGDPVIVGCDSSSTFGSIVKELYEEMVGKHPSIREEIKKRGFSMGPAWLRAEAASETTVDAPDEPLSVNNAVRLIEVLVEKQGGTPVFVVDEFDQITSKTSQKEFTNLIKQVADKYVNARFIFCGIGESVEAIMSAHGSADRYFHAVELGQLPWEARDEIVVNAAKALGIHIDRETNIRIAMISDGFPHYIHLLAEKLFLAVYRANNAGRVTPELFDQAMEETARSMDMKLRGPYEKATEKYGDSYAAILWAAADGHQLKRPSKHIYESYKRIQLERGVDPLPRDKFSQYINRLKKPSHGEILTGSRQGWYEYTEKMIRGYVRLKAELNSVRLQSDHPLSRSLNALHG
ncbi:AAA family ATPase [Roseivivax sp. GX 12232]|uniref:AAA family ATPase n=1 Tax=Roseivivax sp. GX 12232 TaxID=2900547 RepID=UPI001E4216AB|nr:AAA family ATPase [Roseivivax sp. GX 12232]MCE0504136.1 AAA family ATPase [Roseivivax sp. GX 12232]